MSEVKLTAKQYLLWRAQLENWPDSRLVSEREAADWCFKETDSVRHVQIAFGLVCSMQYADRIYYECGWKDGRYRYRGCRYGVEGSEYLSGFSI